MRGEGAHPRPQGEELGPALAPCPTVKGEFLTQHLEPDGFTLQPSHHETSHTSKWGQHAEACRVRKPLSTANPSWPHLLQKLETAHGRM